MQGLNIYFCSFGEGFSSLYNTETWGTEGNTMIELLMKKASLNSGGTQEIKIAL